MTRRYKNKIFGIIYHNVSIKHPDWSQRKVIATTVWCFRKSYKTK